MKERISVILVNYNGGAYNQACIESILKSKTSCDLQVIIVDNASTDDSLAELKKNWKDNVKVQIVELDNNYGFAKGNNEGIKRALEQETKYVLLLNNDTVIEADAIERMVLSQKKTNSIIVPKILYADNPEIIWCAGGKFSPFIKKSFHVGMNQKNGVKYNNSQFCTFANGCCILLSKEIIEKIGLLDEQFFLYYEDNEYSLRAHKNNVAIWYCAEAVVFHKVNGATKGNEKPANAYYITRNWLLCNKMYLGRRFGLFCCYFFVNRFAWAIIWLLQGKPQMIEAMLKGIKHFYKDRTGKY